MLQITTLPVGMLGTNCYVAFSEETRTLYIIDPGGDGDDILGAAAKFRPEKTLVLLTHAHVDHISALGEVTAALKPRTVYLADGDAPLYRSPANAIPPFLPAARNLPATAAATDGDAEFTVLATPGHTPGGAAFYFPAAGVVFVGDSLFAGSVGRTDLPGGSWAQLEASIRQRLFTLPPDTVVYPGHGPATTIGREQSSNPYLA